ncbi:MAG: hypothetical protein IIA17_08530 [candidate division Zixibacteria bacterium]|nr:hypothetical protein [candidate division Zixibacteria bacterium]
MIGTKYINKVMASQKGTAILIVMALIAMLTSVAIMSVNRSTTDIDLSFNALNEDKAFYVAEAGTQRALAEMNNDNGWRSGFYKQVLNGGYYNISLVDSTTDSTLSDTIVLSAKGYFDQSISNLEVWITPVYYYPYRYGLFAGQNLNIARDGCVDAYNSDSGTYAETQINDDGDIGANGNIIMDKFVTVGGDVNTALGGSLFVDIGVTILGDTSTTKDSVTLDMIPPSEYVWAESVSNAPAGLSGAGYTYDAVTKTLVTDASGSVVLQSGVYYFSSISLGQLSTLTLAPGAEVTIYVDSNILFGQGSTVNDGGAPKALEIFSQYGSLQFDQDNTFYGTFYGPNADIFYDQTTQVYGSLIGNSLTLDKNACFHYDQSLYDYKGRTTGEMEAVAWRQN